MNIWGFERIICGPNKGGYKHKYLVRSKESFCLMMTRQKIKGQISKTRPYFFVDSPGFRSISKGCSLSHIEPCIFPAKELKGHILQLPTNKFLDKTVASGKHNYEDSEPKGMVPYNSAMQNICAIAETNLSSNRATISLMDHIDSSCSPAFFSASPVIDGLRGDDSPGSCHNPKHTTIMPSCSHETSGRCVASEIVKDNTIQETTSNATPLEDICAIMAFLSPNPIAPDHPLSKKIQPDYNTSANHFHHTNTSNKTSTSCSSYFLVNNPIPCKQSQLAEDSSSFEGQKFYSLGNRFGRRSSLDSISISGLDR